MSNLTDSMRDRDRLKPMSPTHSLSKMYEKRASVMKKTEKINEKLAAFEGFSFNTDLSHLLES